MTANETSGRAARLTHQNVAKWRRSVGAVALLLWAAGAMIPIAALLYNYGIEVNRNLRHEPVSGSDLVDGTVFFGVGVSMLVLSMVVATMSPPRIRRFVLLAAMLVGFLYVVI